MNKRGVTLIEMLIALIISSIAMMALAVPLIAERAMVGSGKAQTEAQRDAEMVMRAIARNGRQSDTATIFPTTPDSYQLQFSNPATICFQGGPAFGNRLLLGPGGCGAGGGGGGNVLIDGIRSIVTRFIATEIVHNKLVRVHLEVTHTPIVGGPRQEDEVLETEIFLRNGS